MSTLKEVKEQKIKVIFDDIQIEEFNYTLRKRNNRTLTVHSVVALNGVLDVMAFVTYLLILCCIIMLIALSENNLGTVY